jgi:hypothetical protein
MHKKTPVFKKRILPVKQSHNSYATKGSTQKQQNEKKPEPGFAAQAAEAIVGSRRVLIFGAAGLTGVMVEPTVAT